MPLNAHELFNLLADDLTAFAADESAQFSRAADPFHILELLGEAPGKFRIILGWLAETIEGHHRSGIVKHRFVVVVSANRGLQVVQGKQLSVARGSEDPLMQRVAAVRDRVRSFSFPTDEKQTEGVVEYGGCEPTKFEGVNLDAYELTFYLRAALPFNSPR